MKELTLPTIIGSEAQIDWASNILAGPYSLMEEKVQWLKNKITANEGTQIWEKDLAIYERAMELYVNEINSQEKYDAKSLIDNRYALSPVKCAKKALRLAARQLGITCYIPNV